MGMRCISFLVVFCVLFVVPVVADTGYYIHCNVDGAQVIVDGKVIGEIFDHQCWVPWIYDSNQQSLVIVKQNYFEIWDFLVQPWPGLPEHRYYRLNSEDRINYGVDGDVRVFVDPSALNYVYYRDGSLGGKDHNWVYCGNYFGRVFTLHYLPMGEIDIMIRRENYIDAVQSVVVLPGSEIDVAVRMVESNEPRPLMGVDYNQPDKVIKKQPSILVVETPGSKSGYTEVVVELTTPDPTLLVDVVDEIPDDEATVNVIGILMLVGFIGLFVGLGYVFYLKSGL